MLLRIVTDARVPTTLDLVNGQAVTAYRLLKDGFSLGNDAWEHQFSGQRGTQGAKPAPGVPQNRNVMLPIRVYGNTKDDLAQQHATLKSTVDELRRFGGRILFQSNNQTRRQWFRVLVCGTSDTEWSRVETKNIAQLAIVAVCAPYAEGDPMDYTDDFSSDNVNGTNAYFTADLGVLADVTVDTVNKVLKGAASLATEKRLVFTGYGYTYGDQQVTIKATPGATITSFKAGVVLKRVDANNYIEAYVDDNGVNSRLRIDVIIAGARTNRATTNLAARIVNGTAFWVRGRIEGNAITADYFVASANWTSPPLGNVGTSTLTYTLAAGAEQNTLGLTIQGRAGLSFIPQIAAATIDDLEIWPWVYGTGNATRVIQLVGAIPGNAPAIVDAMFAGPGRTNSAEKFALLAWHPRPPASTIAGATAPFGILEGEAGTGLGSTFTSTADALCSGGTYAQVSGAIARCVWTVDPSTMTGDDYSANEIEVEFWARVRLLPAATMTSLTLDLSMRAKNLAGQQIGAVLVPGAPAFPKSVVLPSAGTVYRHVRIGSIRLSCDRLRPLNYELTLLATSGVANAQTGIDFLWMVPLRQRAASPTGKPGDSTYPNFKNGSNSISVKTVRSDLSGILEGAPDHGLGGNLLEFPPGNVNVVAAMTQHVPDDPSIFTDSDIHAAPLAMHFAVTPRYALLRAS